MRRVAIVVCVVAVSGACSKSGSDKTPTRTLTTTASAERVRLIGARHVAGTRRAVADLDRFCGGRSRINRRRPRSRRVATPRSPRCRPAPAPLRARWCSCARRPISSR
jgi:hypothetical protein